MVNQLCPECQELFDLLVPFPQHYKVIKKATYFIDYEFSCPFCEHQFISRTWIDFPKKKLKSLNFKVLKEKLLSGEKDQTYRCLFIPPFEIGEIIKIKFLGAVLFEARILNIYPKQLKDVTLEEAKRDGFKSIEAFQQGIMKLNNIKSMYRWGFIIRFKRVSEIFTEVIEQEPNLIPITYYL